MTELPTKTVAAVAAKTDAVPVGGAERKTPRWHVHRRLYDWTLSFAHKPGSTWALFWFSFAEASFFPIPPDVLMVPMCLERRERTWFYTTVATVGSVLGVCGYGIGVMAHHVQWVHQCVFWLLDGQSNIERVQGSLGSLWVITVATIIFHPYKLLTIAAGFLHGDIAVFITGSAIGRAVRFLFVAAMVYWFGPVVKEKIDRYFHWLSIGLLVLIVGASLLKVMGKHGGGGG